MRALTGLNHAGKVALGTDCAGRLAEMPLKKIHPDPNNSRRPEDENSPEGQIEQLELTEDIKKRGVKSPISLRPHPTIAGEYLVNFGHRRLIGAGQAGLSAIPYFLDAAFDSYDQVKENLLHRRPSVWALANFVQRMLNQSQSKKEIAEGLGKNNQNLVTELQALVDAPICLHHAHALGVTSTRTLYDLRRSYDEFPNQVEAWCKSGAHITRATIQELLIELRETKVSATIAVGSTDTQDATDEGPVRDTGNVDVSKRMPVGTHIKPPSPAAGMESPQTRDSSPPQVVGHTTVRDLRHDVIESPSSDTSEPRLISHKHPDLAAEIILEYQGKSAKIAPSAILKIVVDGDNNFLDVPVCELRLRKIH